MRPVHQLRDLRRRVLTPSLQEVDPEYRGFYQWAQGDSIVPPVGRAFLIGYGAGAYEKNATSLMRRIDRIAPRWRGFAIEGAGMSMAMRDSLEPWRRSEFDRLLTMAGAQHGYLIYVGLGWALARLPHALWPRLERFDPLMVPLALDGYGFHQVFFHTRKTLDSAEPPEFPTHRWPGPTEDAHQQVMQGVGRGLWFVSGGNPQVAARLIGQYPARFHDSLWAGIGLAAAFAGGRDERGLDDVAHAAGTHLPWLRQGAAFGIEARIRGGTRTSHTDTAAHILCNAQADDIAALTWTLRPDAQHLAEHGTGSYETWRRSIATELGAA